jgi:FkbM family methyltransferase
MTSLERAARWLKYGLGLNDSSAAIATVRPFYNQFLEILYRRRGLVRKMAGCEPIRIRPTSRYFRDNFEVEIFRFMRRVVRPGDAVLDVGANVGVFTVLLARWVGTGGHVYAFEPTLEARAGLQDHLILNHVADRVTIIPDAISDAPGRSSFHTVGISGENTLSPKHSRLPTADAIEVSVTTIDAFCLERGIIPSLIKIDIEGYEIHALRGAREILARHSPLVVVELHPMNWPEIGVNAEELTGLLDEMNYQTNALGENPDAMSPNDHLVLTPRLTGEKLRTKG